MGIHCWILEEGANTYFGFENWGASTLLAFEKGGT